MPALIARFFHLLDQFVAPEARQALIARGGQFAREQPFLASYIALFAAFAIPSVLGLVITALVFAAIALFWISVALLVFGGFVFLSGILATGVWAYAVFVYLTARWVAQYLLPVQPPRPGPEKSSAATTMDPAAPMHADKVNKEAEDEKTTLPTPPGSPTGADFADESSQPQSPSQSPTESEGDAETEREKIRRDIARSLR